MSRELITMSLRRVREGSGSYTSQPEGAWAQQAPDLNAVFGDIPFLIIGGLATRLYMPERMTLDVDVLVSVEQGKDAEAALAQAGATKLGPLSIGGSSWRWRDGRCIDLVQLDRSWLPKAFVHARRGEDGLPYIDLPWLILLKLEASRSQDLADCTRMLGMANNSMLDKIRRVVKRYRPADLDDTESLIKLGQLEWKARDRDTGNR